MIANPAGRLAGDFMGTPDELAFLAGTRVCHYSSDYAE